jgi:uncharacterized repeat protein (TIGR01451 family)
MLEHSIKRAVGARSLLMAAAALYPAFVLLPSRAEAAGTPAGAQIQNVARATYDRPDGSSTSVDSNAVVLVVDELLDVTVSWADPADVGTTAGATAQLLRYTVTNGGNGTERFVLATLENAGGDDFDPAVTSIILDSNGNGAFDPGVDTTYVAGSNDPELDADESIGVFVLSTIPAAGTDGQRGRVDLTAAAVTGTGAPGASFAGQGQGGGDAVVGATGADAEDDGYYLISGATLSFVKSASVADPYGGSTQAPGAIITYTLTATVGGTGSLANLRVTDPIPADTTYEAGSITLDGAPLTDAADGDAGRLNGTDIEVALGTVAGGTAHVISFKVKID